MYNKLFLSQNPGKDIGHMVEEWVAFVETCGESEENEILRLTLSQVIGSGNITFVLAEPLHAFGRIYFLVMITNAPICHVHSLVTEVSWTYLATIGAPYTTDLKKTITSRQFNKI